MQHFHHTALSSTANIMSTQSVNYQSSIHVCQGVKMRQTIKRWLLLWRSQRSRAEWHKHPCTASCCLLMRKPPVVLWATYLDVRPSQPQRNQHTTCQASWLNCMAAGASEMISKITHRGIFGQRGVISVWHSFKPVFSFISYMNCRRRWQQDRQVGRPVMTLHVKKEDAISRLWFY